jgi:peptidoglycan glycosyltransferase
MTKSLNRMALAMLMCFVIVGASLTYWGVVASDSMLARDDNPRRVETEMAILRGGIYDRNGQLLAQTVRAGISPSGKPIVRRDYPFPQLSSAIGYYSLIHGVGGVEAAMDLTLRGDDLRSPGEGTLAAMLHQPQIGGDVRVTVDSRLQLTIAEAFKGRRGAVIAIDVPSGAVLALVSVPTFDPNTLNANYDALLTDPASPLLNRVTQGIYQPGGVLQTVILASMLTNGTANGTSNTVTLDAPATAATAPVQIGDLTITCAGLASQISATTLGAAYANACPAPFASAMVEQPANIQKMIGAFGLLEAPKLVRFQTVTGRPTLSITGLTDPARLRAHGVGQDELIVTPLQMALVACIVANHGNAVTPYIVDATRPVGTTTWKTLPAPEEQTAIITQEVADTLRTAMRDAVEKGAARAVKRPGQPDLAIYGHASIAYTGPGKNADSWFIGFVEQPGGKAIVVAVVVEGTNDPAVAAEIGGLALVEAGK